MKVSLMKVFMVVLFLFVGLSVASVARADVLWYNGDFNGAQGLTNEINSVVADSRIYEDFIVGATGWNVNDIFSNNLFDSSMSSTQAAWEIRSNVSDGNGGSLIASGTNVATQTATGRDLYGIYQEFEIRVSGLSISLDPGIYWLSIAPISERQGFGRSYASTTSGLNSFGIPAGDNGNAFVASDFFINQGQIPYNFVSTRYIGAGYENFSFGIDGIVGGGNAVPEPASLVLFATGLFCAVLRKKLA